MHVSGYSPSSAIVKMNQDGGATVLTGAVEIGQGYGTIVAQIAALLDKPDRRIRPVEVSYVGFQIPDEFVIGYGLDFAEDFEVDFVKVLRHGVRVLGWQGWRE